MSNTWEQLDPQMKAKLARQLMVGKPVNQDNMNRAMEILANDPRKVDEMMQDAGIDSGDHDLPDAQVDDTEGGEEEGSIDQAVEDSLANSSSADMQQTGKVASDIPPPEPGEDIQAYLRRLIAMQAPGANKVGQPTGPAVEDDE